MQYAVWIALAVVFIAIAPSLFKSVKAKGGNDADGSGDGGDRDGDGGGSSDGGD